MNTDLMASIQYIEKEKNISREVLIDALKQALHSACRKTFHDVEKIEIEIDPDTFQISVKEDGKVIEHGEFGRIAAQTARQVIIQKLRDAEKENVYNEFKAKEGEIITGLVHTVDRKTIIVDLGKAEGILPAREQVFKERFRQGNMIRAFVNEVRMGARGPEIILSRVNSKFIEKLFELEVPEIYEGIVKIVGIARDPGARAKVAVRSTDDKVDCVGSCVGMRGQRVKNIITELGGEKIDIIRYSPDDETFIRAALAPAEISRIKLFEKTRKAEVQVTDDQIALALGRREQNARLAEKLTGWNLEIRSLSQKVPISGLKDVGAALAIDLKLQGFQSIRDVFKATPEELMRIDGIDEEKAVRIIDQAQAAILNSASGEGDPKGSDAFKSESTSAADITLGDGDEKVEAEVNVEPIDEVVVEDEARLD